MDPPKDPSLKRPAPDSSKSVDDTERRASFGGQNSPQEEIDRTGREQAARAAINFNPNAAMDITTDLIGEDHNYSCNRDSYLKTVAYELWPDDATARTQMLSRYLARPDLRFSEFVASLRKEDRWSVCEDAKVHHALFHAIVHAGVLVEDKEWLVASANAIWPELSSNQRAHHMIDKMNENTCGPFGFLRSLDHESLMTLLVYCADFSRTNNLQ